jgi:hypothetical protein
MQLEGLGTLQKKIIDLIRNQTLHLPVCGIVPKPTTLPHAPLHRIDWVILRNQCSISMSSNQDLSCNIIGMYCSVLQGELNMPQIV